MIFISAWALTLSVQLQWAMLEPQFVGQTAGSSHVFFLSLLVIKIFYPSVGNQSEI